MNIFIIIISCIITFLLFGIMVGLFCVVSYLKEITENLEGFTEFVVDFAESIENDDDDDWWKTGKKAPF